MACYDSGSFVCSYDSNAAAGKDYTSLATWEAASDNDLSGLGVVSLDCFDSQNHNDSVTLAGATNTDATHYRQIRSAAGCATPWAGKVGTGANFVYTGTSNLVFYSDESYFRFVNIAVKSTSSYAGTAGSLVLNATYGKIIGCICYDSAYIGQTRNGITTGSNNCIFFGCISYGNSGRGFGANDGTGESIGIVCCTAIGNGGYGFEELTSSGGAYVWSCYGADNSSGDFYESGWDAPSDRNCSKDATADLGGTSSNYQINTDLTSKMDADYLPTEALGYGRNPHNDLTATWDADNFLYDGTNVDDLFKVDILGNSWPWDTADAAIDVGAAQYVPTGIPSAILAYYYQNQL